MNKKENNSNKIEQKNSITESLNSDLKHTETEEKKNFDKIENIIFGSLNLH